MKKFDPTGPLATLGGGITAALSQLDTALSILLSVAGLAYTYYSYQRQRRRDAADEKGQSEN